MEHLATAQAVTPPSELRSKIWNKIQQEQNVEEVSPALSTDIPEIKDHRESTERVNIQKNTNWKPYAIAASLLFLISVCGNVFMMNTQSSDKRKWLYWLLIKGSGSDHGKNESED